MGKYCEELVWHNYTRNERTCAGNRLETILLHKQASATGAAPKEEAKTRCSEQKPNWIKMHFFIETIVIRCGFAVYQVRHTDFSALLGKANYSKDWKSKNKTCLTLSNM